MAQVHLTAGTIDYLDNGGSGPVVVLLHGVAMDGTVWRHVAAELATDFRVVIPTIPLGGHRVPMREDADLSIIGIAGLVAEFLEALELRDVALAVNDWGGALALVALGRHERIGRLVVTSCEAFDNFPPGFPGLSLMRSAKVPGGLAFAFELLKSKPLRRLPMTWGWMSKRPVPADIMDGWFQSVWTDKAVRRDLRKYVLGLSSDEELLRWSRALSEFTGPALVAWAAEDKVMPPEHGRRLAQILPDARHVSIDDSYTLIPEDQPQVLTDHIRSFLLETASPLQ